MLVALQQLSKKYHKICSQFSYASEPLCAVAAASADYTMLHTHFSHSRSARRSNTIKAGCDVKHSENQSYVRIYYAAAVAAVVAIRMPGFRISGSQPRPEPSQDWSSNTTRFYGHPRPESRFECFVCKLTLQLAAKRIF